MTNIKFEFSCFSVLRLAPCVIDKNNKWICYYEFAKSYIAMSYFLNCVKCISLYFKFIADLELKKKLEILSEKWNCNIEVEC